MQHRPTMAQDILQIKDTASWKDRIEWNKWAISETRKPEGNCRIAEYTVMKMWLSFHNPFFKFTWDDTTVHWVKFVFLIKWTDLDNLTECISLSVCKLDLSKKGTRTDQASFPGLLKHVERIKRMHHRLNEELLLAFHSQAVHGVTNEVIKVIYKPSVQDKLVSSVIWNLFFPPCHKVKCDKKPLFAL